MLRTIVLFIAFTLLADHAGAGVKTPSWSTRVDAPVTWQQMTIAGTLMIATPRALIGLDAATGKELWRRDKLKNVSADNLEEIPGTALVVLSDPRDDSRVVILDVLTGTAVFDSQQEKLAKVLDKKVLGKSGSLLVAGFEAMKPETTLFLFDIQTGKRKWTSDALHKGKGKLVKFLTAVVEATQNISPISSSPVELPDGSFLLAASGNVYRMSSNDGKVMWKTSFPWGAPHLYLSERDPDTVFIGAGYGGDAYLEGHQSTYHALDLATGTARWPEPKRFRGAFNPHIVFADQGLVISEHTEGKGWLRLLDYASGDSEWGKKGRGIKIKGGVVAHTISGTQMVITTGYDSAWNDEGTEYYLYLVDLAGGALRQKKPIKVRGELLATHALPGGVLYATSHEVNVLDTTTGKLTRSKKLIRATANERFLYAFSQDDGLLHKLDLMSGIATPLSTAKVKLNGKDSPLSLEIRDDHVVLIGRQSVTRWRMDGAMEFHAYHPAPRRNAVLRALLYAQAARSAAASFASGVYAAGFAQASNNYDRGDVGYTMTTAFADGYAEMSEGYGNLTVDYWKEASRRFQASAEARDFVFMMVRQDNGKFGLAQVSKDSGDIVGIIDLGKDKKPRYQVDDIGNWVFRQTNPAEIVAYQF